MASNIGKLRLFGADIVVTTGDGESSHDCLRALRPEIVSSGGGGISLRLLQGKQFQGDDQRRTEFRTIDYDGVGTSSKLSVVDDDVDTSLKLSTAASRNPNPPVYCPMPLRSFPPGIIPAADFRPGSGGSYDRNAVEISEPNHVKRGKPGKRKQDNMGDEKERRSAKRKRKNGAEDGDSCPVPSLEDIPGLLQIIESRDGTRPVLLYRKELEESDVSSHHNRLFVNEKERLMDFLTGEEASALNRGKGGLEIFAVDPQGRLYKLVLKIWPSLKRMVVNSDWNKLVSANNAEKEDWIQMWGYREGGKLCLAINFTKNPKPNSGSKSSSSSVGELRF